MCQRCTRALLNLCCVVGQGQDVPDRHSVFCWEYRVDTEQPVSTFELPVDKAEKD